MSDKTLIEENLSFFEFVRREAYSFNDPASVEWTESYLKILLKRHLVHGGDCTKQPYPCELCIIETLLSDYRQYSFHYEQWKKDNFEK